MDNGGERKRMPRLVGGSGLEDANSARRVVNPSRYSGGEPREQGPGCGAEGGIRPMRPMNAENTESTATLSDTCRG